MNDKPFFDTNVILYAFRQDDARGQVAKALLAEGGALSVQVLNELVAVARPSHHHQDASCCRSPARGLLMVAS